MVDGDSLDPWDTAFAAQQERAAGASPRPMLTRADAMAKADAYFREEGRPDVAVTATPNPLQGLWIVGHQDPSQPDELVIGNGPLVVPSDGPVYMANGSVPPWPEELGLEEPECWRYDRGEDLLGGGWDERLRGELKEPYWYELLDFLAEERGKYEVFPSPSQTFKAFELTPYDEVKVVILGQDPYPNPGEAHGLAFSVPAHVKKKPPSLKNIHQVFESDLSELGVTPPAHGNLEAWAEQGVLLLNTALTVRAGTKADRDVHRRWRWGDKGWATFTDAVIKAVNDKTDRVVFILWGNDAKKKDDKQGLIDRTRHAVIKSSHPSPFSARLGFLTSRPFSEANKELSAAGREIDWGRICHPSETLPTRRVTTGTGDDVEFEPGT